MKCPVCKGKGEIANPKQDKDFERVKVRMTKVLRKEGFSIREIMKLLGYKSPRSIMENLKKMITRAKFKVTGLSQNEYTGDGKEITLKPVTTGSEENKQFYRMTPAGEIKLMTVNAEVSNQFSIGDEYYIDFTKADKAE